MLRHSSLITLQRLYYDVDAALNPLETGDMLVVTKHGRFIALIYRADNDHIVEQVNMFADLGIGMLTVAYDRLPYDTFRFDPHDRVSRVELGTALVLYDDFRCQTAKYVVQPIAPGVESVLLQLGLESGALTIGNGPAIPVDELIAAERDA